MLSKNRRSGKAQRARHCFGRTHGGHGAGAPLPTLRLPPQPNTWYFGAGPAMLPDSILQDVAMELFDWQGTGVSILEISHRSPEFSAMLQQTEQSLRLLLGITDNYHVLFAGLPARALFGMIPMNLLQEGRQGAYWVTGVWSQLAYEEALKLKKAHRIIHDGLSDDLSAFQWSLELLPDYCSYLYYTPNETLHGVYAPKPVLSKPLPLIADMTSCLLTEPVVVSDYDLIFAGAQKNIAGAGMTLMIIKDSLLSRCEGVLPAMSDFRVHAAHRSLAATPPVFNCYLASKMLAWVIDQGGISALYDLNQTKAKKLYDYIDASSFYICPVHPANRSITNVCFSLVQPEKEALFLERAGERHLLGLKGHRLVGGFRASLYNAMPMAGVDCLIEFMDDFIS